MKGSKKAKGLVVHRLENVSRKAFSKYFDLITDLVESSPGVYALYDDTELYYVGKSTDLKRRVRAHLKDRHLASWTHFSLYLVRKEAHIHEIESLLIRIANPKGNRKVPHSQSSGASDKKIKENGKRKTC
jgi:hypothetical protein